MARREETDLRALERREGQLWLLAIVMITVLAAGLVLTAWPMLRSGQADRTQKAFLGLVVLTLLFNAYLIERQGKIKKLRRRLIESEARNLAVVLQASKTLLASLPGEEQFNDRLAMDVKRATALGQPISVVAFKIEMPADSAEELKSEAWGQAAELIVPHLKEGESLYRRAEGVFCMLHVACPHDDAEHAAATLGEALATDERMMKLAARIRTRVTTYPDDTQSLHEMEQLAVRGLVA